MRTSLPELSAYESTDGRLLKEEKEVHLCRRIVAQHKVHNQYSTSTATLLKCSSVNESNAPTMIKNLKMRTIAHCEVQLQLRPSHIPSSTRTMKSTKTR